MMPGYFVFLRNALGFTRGARTKPSVTQRRDDGRFTQAGAVGAQRLVQRLGQLTHLPLREHLNHTFSTLTSCAY